MEAPDQTRPARSQRPSVPFVLGESTVDAIAAYFPWHFYGESWDIAAIRHLALYERATNYAAQGKMARKDLERILAEDSTFEGVKERLAELSD